ncbi:MAG: MerR family transcriptional regulator [Chloroflexi bacterium]|nr:MerR family transcriptional regulator [Chloroflexota bacterium]
MFKIGVFSKLSRVPVKTLRYYHQIGLLAPARIDDFTGYRYYTAVQMARLNRILALKDLGFSLEQIGRLLEESLSPEQIRGLLRVKQSEIESQIETERARLARVAARLDQMDKEATMPKFDVVIKKVEDMQVAGVRDIIPDYKSIGPLYEELFATLGQHRVTPAGPGMGIYYDEEYKESDVDVEAAVPVSGVPLDSRQLPDGGRVALRNLPGAEMATLIRKGPYDDFTPAYQALMEWVQANGYRIVGPNRELYLQGPGPGIDPADYVVEIQFPVSKS